MLPKSKPRSLGLVQSHFSFLLWLLLQLSRQREKFFWGLLALIFFFFSIDDAVYLHERIAGYFRDHIVLLQDFPSYIWTVLYMPLLLFSLGTLLLLLWRKADPVLRFSVMGVFVLLAFAALLDFTDGLVQRDSDLVLCATKECHRVMLHLMRLVEEAFEVWAIGGLGYLVLFEYCLLDVQKKESTP